MKEDAASCGKIGEESAKLWWVSYLGSWNE